MGEDSSRTFFNKANEMYIDATEMLKNGLENVFERLITRSVGMIASTREVLFDPSLIDTRHPAVQSKASSELSEQDFDELEFRLFTDFLPQDLDELRILIDNCIENESRQEDMHGFLDLIEQYCEQTNIETETIVASLPYRINSDGLYEIGFITNNLPEAYDG